MVVAAEISVMSSKFKQTISHEIFESFYFRRIDLTQNSRVSSEIWFWTTDEIAETSATINSSKEL